MQTQLNTKLLSAGELAEADRILRACVHCGFCTATCPTYQLLGDELDGPRGRIYLIKQLLEGQSASTATRLHLDRCLSCRSCETTCPSGVEYSSLLELGRLAMETALPRSTGERVMRHAMKTVLPYPKRFAALLKTARLFKPLLPATLAAKLPPAHQVSARPVQQHARQVILFDGCVQSVAAQQINAALRRVLDQLGISCISVPRERCCGAVDHHLQDHPQAARLARDNIDSWIPLLEQGAEKVLFSASACALEVSEYARMLQGDADYAALAQQVSENSMDIGQFLSNELAGRLQAGPGAPKIAFHAPCTLQHGLGNKSGVQTLLQQMGFDVHEPSDSHLCCGSAGTYSVTQPALSRQLRQHKLQALSAAVPARIATANIGCMLHMAEASAVPVQHWIEIVDEFAVPAG